MWNNSSETQATMKTKGGVEDFPEGLLDSATAGKSALMIVSIAIALTGNFFILFAFFRNFKMRTATNLLVVNLCLSDLLSALVEAPLWFSILSEQLIQKQPLLCRILLSFEDLFQVAALLNMCAISMDRFMALVRGSKRKMSRSRAQQVLACCWLYALAFSIPWSLISDLEPERCHYFPLFYEPGIDIRIINVFFKVICVILPIIVVYYIFYRILKAARSSRKVNTESSYISRNSSAERFAVDAHIRSSKTAIILFLMFSICTLPYLGISIWSMVAQNQPRSFNTGFTIYFVFSLKRSLFPAIYIFRNRVIVSYLTETIKCNNCGERTKPSLRNSFSYVPSQTGSPVLDPGPCFVVFGRRSHRSRIHPSVYDGDHQYFPKNLDVYFCTLKEQSKSTNQFSDISIDDRLQEQQFAEDEGTI